MKIVIIGLGSMGRRRIRNLQNLGYTNIFGYDKNEKRNAQVASEYGITILPSLSKKILDGFTFAVIATPPQFHLIFVKLCVNAHVPFFTELNLLTKDTLVIKRLVDNAGLVASPSNTELFDTDVLTLQKKIGTNFKGYALFQLGQNIHDWHPWQPVAEYFISQPETNGIREMLRIELPWLLQIFGSVKKISATGVPLFSKKIKVNDLVTAQLIFTSGVRLLIVFDLISRVVIKRFTAVNDNKNIVWDERNNKIEVTDKGKTEIIMLRDKTRLQKYQFPEDAHLAEMNYVVKVLTKQCKPKYDFADEVVLLRLIDKIEAAMK